MSTSSSLSSAKRRRAGGLEPPAQNVSNVENQVNEESKKLMSVQDVLYILNSKIERLNVKMNENTRGGGVSVDSSETINQLTDSIDTVNATLEQFTQVLSEYNDRLQKLEDNTMNETLQEKIQQLEKRINDKILSKNNNSELLSNLTKKKSQPISTKDKLDNMVPNKKGATISDKFAEKTNQKGKSNLKQFEEASAGAEGDNNVKISFSGLKDKIETNKE